MIKIPNKIYDILKWSVMIGAPALVTLLVTLNSLWGWNLPIDAITGTITAIATFVGVMLGISTINYNKECDKNE